MASPPPGPVASTSNLQAPTAAVPPTTPQKAAPLSEPVPNLQSTPLSHGTATHFGSAIDTKLDQHNVKAWLAVDLQRQKACDFDKLLKYILSLCVPDGVTIDKDLLFDKCLKTVLPICNLDEVTTRIDSYCGEATNERSRYAGFVSTFNFALDQLDKVGKGDAHDREDLHKFLRPAPAWRSSMVLMRSDPKIITSKYTVQMSKRSPDIIMVDVASAQRAYALLPSRALHSEQNRDASSILLGDTPPVALDWPQVKASWEFKLRNHTLKKPARPYALESKSKDTYPPFVSGDYPEEGPVEDPVEPPRHAVAVKSEPLSPTPARPRGSSKSSKPQPHSHAVLSRLPGVATGAKRKADSQPKLQGTAKKICVNNAEKIIPDLQCASYAAERLGCLPCVTHAIEFLIVDDVLWLFWFDRHGIIQTTGLNFIQDLPRFMVLLLALSRFNRANWGIPSGFPERVGSDTLRRSARITPPGEAPVADSNLVIPEYIAERATMNARAPAHNATVNDPHNNTTVNGDSHNPPTGGSPVDDARTGGEESAGGHQTDQASIRVTDQHTIKVNWTDQVYSAYQLVGRATQVYGASEEGREERLVMKISFPDKSRVPEPEVIKKARDTDVEILDPKSGKFPIDRHLPNLICAMDVPGWDSGDVREAVGLMTSDEERRKRRVLRVTIYERLTPLHHLRGTDFRRCWFHIVHCHFLLWKKGVCHNDPSLGNYYVRTIKGVHYGVLNDWDLATIVGLSCHDGIERTGTLPFMAVDLCHPNFWFGLLVRLYRHELEGKIWVLPWTHLQCDEENVMRSHPELECWLGDLASSRRAKRDMCTEWDDYAPLAGWESEWPLAYSLCEMLHEADFARDRAKRNHKRDPDHYPSPEEAELSTEAVYEEFWAKVKEFYKAKGAEEAYKALREELCLPVDL